MTMTDPLAVVPKDRLPRHVAVIMDGNGRWAQIRGMPRNFGHKQGVEATRGLVRAAHEIGLEALTIYGFSTENWSRPAEEVSLLMGLLKSYFTAEISELHKAGWQSASEVGPGKPVIPRRLDLLTATGGVSEFGKLLPGFK